MFYEYVSLIFYFNGKNFKITNDIRKHAILFLMFSLWDLIKIINFQIIELTKIFKLYTSLDSWHIINLTFSNIAAENIIASIFLWAV